MKLVFILLMGVLCLSACQQKPLESTTQTPTSTYCASKTTDIAWYTSGQKAPLLPGLEGLNFTVTTNQEEAQRYFNQGLVLAFGFNHAEAARSFFEATRIDPECAMCHWGFAYVLGPNYNAGMEPDNYARAYTAIQKALVFSSKVTPKERDLIEAMSKRYPPEAVEDRSAYDEAYSAAMKALHQKYPNDVHIMAMYAESIMDLHPWDLWEKTGEAKPWTPEILQLLEQAIALDANHPGALHFHIHATEASQNPERGLPSADRLRDLVPGAGHLVHMPSHTYIRTGDYHKGTLANLKAVAIDSAYLSACYAQGSYPLALYPHNWHFLSATATFEGNSKLAMQAAKKVSDNADREVMQEPGWGTLQHFYTIPYYVAIKFGKWDEILAMRNFDPAMKYPDAVRRYARGMAYLGKNDLQQAKVELAALNVHANDESLKEVTIWDINDTYTLLQIARRVLEGEILAKEGRYEASIRLLQSAVEIEDQLGYEEPPDWFFSVRHHLGAVLLEAGRFAEAEKAYREDLQVFKKNGWALHGLAKALEGQGKRAAAADVWSQFENAWQYADITLTNSRIL
ncbi:MAG TPA: hypothetical protein PKC76_13160 [Saprospiraceae bacterium]|nr:hypothetical protein [Saprospiraceae bacterium]HMP25081.1 hypothetical protein [Saprospiraceae bacterium]